MFPSHDRCRRFTQLFSGRFVGTANRRTLLDVSFESATGPAYTGRVFMSNEQIQNAINLAVETFSSSNEYWIHYAKRVYKISNNSNVAMRFGLRYWTAKRDGTESIVDKIQVYDGTTFFPNNATDDAIAVTDDWIVTTYENLDLVGISPIKRHLGYFFKISRRKAITLNPGTTTYITCQFKGPRLYRGNIYNDTAGTGEISMLGGLTKGILLDWAGDVLPSTTGTYASGTNAGDVSWIIRDSYIISKREDNYPTTYHDVLTGGISGTGLTCFGYDNNAAVAAV